MKPAAVTLVCLRDGDGGDHGGGGGGRGGAGRHRGRSRGRGGCLAHEPVVLGADEVVPLARGPHRHTVLLLVGVTGLAAVPAVVAAAAEGCAITPHIGLLCLLVIQTNPNLIGPNQTLDKVVLRLGGDTGEVIVTLALTLISGTVPVCLCVKELVTFASKVRKS